MTADNQDIQESNHCRRAMSVIADALVENFDEGILCRRLDGFVDIAHAEEKGDYHDETEDAVDADAEDHSPRDDC